MVELVDMLKARIIGQDEAVMRVSRVIKMARVGLRDPRRPVGTFLFLGPTGVGKMELARALAEVMFGEDAMLDLDMSEFQSEAGLNYLIGDVDKKEGGKLTEWVRRNPYSVIVFDEIETAHHHASLLLLQIMEEGRLIDGRGKAVDFSNTIIIVTSNLGARHLAVPVLTDASKEAALEDARIHLRPEIVNRLDEVMFHALSDEDLSKIMRLMLKQEAQMIIDQKGITLNISEAAIQWLLDQNKELEYGVRPLKRIIRRSLREPLADFLIRLDPPAGTEIKIDMAAKKDGGLTFSAVINGKEVAVEG